MLFKIFSKKMETKKEGVQREFMIYGICRRESDAKDAELPQVKFSNDCLKEMLKADIELPQTSGLFLLEIDENKKVTKNNELVAPYFYVEAKDKKGGVHVRPTIWFLGSVVKIERIKTDNASKVAEFAYNEEQENLFAEAKIVDEISDEEFDRQVDEALQTNGTLD